MPMRSSATLLNGLAAVVAVLVLGSAALASPAAAESNHPAGLTAAESSALDARVEAELRRVPGGTRVGLNEIAWWGGRVVMTFGVAGGTVGATATSTIS